MSGTPELSIVIPLLNEAESLPELHSRIVESCESLARNFEMLFIDDGSNDGSWDVIQKLGDKDGRVRGLQLRRNYGKSAALSAGFKKARGEYIITMDADLQDDPFEIPNLVSKLEEGYDLVSGWKQKRNDPLEKRIPSKFFNFVTRLLSGIKLHDFNCGLKIYRSEVAKSVHLYSELHRYIPLLAKWEGYDRITEIPVKHHARQFGKTKFGFGRYITGFLDLITVMFLTRFAAQPMQLFGSLGTISFAGGFIISAYLSIEKWVFDKPIGRRPLLFLGILLILVGVILFVTGLLGEMIARNRDENSGGPDIKERVE